MRTRSHVTRSHQARPGLPPSSRASAPDSRTSSGALDRRKLGAIAFSDPAARHDLERIIHPIVRARTDDWFAALDARQPFAIADIPLLYETGRERDFDAVVVTACAEETQLRRVMRRDSITEAEARQRMAAQLPTSEKVSRADHVIKTDGSFEETNRQVRTCMRRWFVTDLAFVGGDATASGPVDRSCERDSPCVDHLPLTTTRSLAPPSTYWPSTS